MPRFTSKSFRVEAYQYQGNTLNLDGQFNAAIISFQPGASASVKYRGAVLTLLPGDWLVRGVDGVVAPVSGAAFEMMFEPTQDMGAAPRETLTLKRKLANVG